MYCFAIKPWVAFWYWARLAKRITFCNFPLPYRLGILWRGTISRVHAGPSCWYQPKAPWDLTCQSNHQQKHWCIAGGHINLLPSPWFFSPSSSKQHWTLGKCIWIVFVIFVETWHQKEVSDSSFFWESTFVRAPKKMPSQKGSAGSASNLQLKPTSDLSVSRSVILNGELGGKMIV